mgnify:CR=1 FL=1
MINIRGAFAGVLAALLMVLGISGTAQAADKRPAVRSVCETGFRGQPAYDAKCLKTGTVLNGVNLWFRSFDGKLISNADRRAFCKDANQARTTRAGIIDGLFDVAYDHYRNHMFVLNVTATVGVMDCKQLGIKIKK